MIARGFLGRQKILNKIFLAILLSLVFCKTKRVLNTKIKRINFENFYSNWSIPHFSAQKKTNYEGTVDTWGAGIVKNRESPDFRSPEDGISGLMWRTFFMLLGLEWWYVLMRNETYLISFSC